MYVSKFRKSVREISVEALAYILVLLFRDNDRILWHGRPLSDNCEKNRITGHDWTYTRPPASTGVRMRICHSAYPPTYRRWRQRARGGKRHMRPLPPSSSARTSVLVRLSLSADTAVWRRTAIIRSFFSVLRPSVNTHRVQVVLIEFIILFGFEFFRTYLRVCVLVFVCILHFETIVIYHGLCSAIVHFISDTWYPPIVTTVMVVLENPTPDPLATGVGLVQDAAATTPLTVDTTGAVAPQHHQTSGSCLSATYPIPTTAAAAAAGQRHQLKMVPKRFINMHQWFNPIGVKQIKEAMVRVNRHPSSP